MYNVEREWLHVSHFDSFEHFIVSQELALPLSADLMTATMRSLVPVTMRSLVPVT